eukprot:CAMPEP_0117655782 /NCGR_PEP_ID=MMETSP0804-20121206/4461_1 /TAXON_ID=1074897 /ORGANISM="Tetraselmis astigmatica, Strain CCMP880" /LENGTH=122 /DNA_ID=CAMNT_0005462153 /DNA_START=1163 /DNA_END=1531 /DNA_ORIENTATION=+
MKDRAAPSPSHSASRGSCSRQRPVMHHDHPHSAVPLSPFLSPIPSSEALLADVSRHRRLREQTVLAALLDCGGHPLRRGGGGAQLLPALRPLQLVPEWTRTVIGRRRMGRPMDSLFYISASV